MKSLGQIGEDLAVNFLRTKGYRIIDRNFRIRGGEIDIIALDKNCLVYVEVKTRSNQRFGLPEESVTPFKVRFLKRAAQFYRSSHPNLPVLERIDVLSINISDLNEINFKLITNITG